MKEHDKMTLAKAMGAQFTTISNGSWAHVNVPGGKAFKDWWPEQDANDDYAVLEWMRETYEPQQIEAAFDHQGFGHRWAYDVGSYAIAAFDLISGRIGACPHCGGER